MSRLIFIPSSCSRLVSVYNSVDFVVGFHETDVCNWARDRVWETITTDLLPPFRNKIKYIILYFTTVKRRRQYFILLSNRLNPNTQNTDNNDNNNYYYAVKGRYQIVWTLLHQTSLIWRIHRCFNSRKRKALTRQWLKISSWTIRCYWPNLLRKIRILIK